MNNPRPRTRLASIDWMRGMVMVLMALDHASIFFNAERLALDSADLYSAGTPLPNAQFFARWITHPGAPTFFFLAGTALALSAARRTSVGQSSWQIDRDVLIRGTLIASIEFVLMGSLGPTRLISVLFAMGASMILMVPLRRLPDAWLVGLAVGWYVGAEWLTSLVWQGHGDAPLWAALTVARHYSDSVHVLYPVLQWLPMMMLGWAFGNHLQRRRDAGRPPPIMTLLVWGGAALVLFAVIQSLRGYGTMFMPEEATTVAQWLHVSKYPPSLAFVALGLGLMSIYLAGFMWLEQHVDVRPNGLLLVLGQTALFFYILHFPLLGIGGIGLRFALGLELSVAPGGLGMAIGAAALVLAMLYPLCRRFRDYKRAHPDRWVRFI